jgi:hypothetical protein
MNAEKAIDLFNIISFFVSILLLLGLLGTKAVLFRKVSFVVKMIVGILLLFKFNDFFPQKQFSILDRKLCFLAGTYIVAFTLGDALSGYSDANDKIETILDVSHLLK